MSFEQVVEDAARKDLFARILFCEDKNKIQSVIQLGVVSCLRVFQCLPFIVLLKQSILSSTAGMWPTFATH